jgi:hypothetical protein
LDLASLDKKSSLRSTFLLFIEVTSGCGTGFLGTALLYWLLTKVILSVFVSTDSLSQMSNDEMEKLPSMFGYPIALLAPIFLLSFGPLLFGWIALVLKCSLGGVRSIKLIATILGCLGGLWVGLWLSVGFGYLSWNEPTLEFNLECCLSTAALIGAFVGYRLRPKRH